MLLIFYKAYSLFSNIVNLKNKVKKMINKLLQLFNLKIIKLEPKKSLKDIDFEADGKNPYDPIDPVKETVVKIEKEKISYLTIYFIQGNYITWNVISDLDYKLFPWSDFYTWYYSRNTSFFIFQFSKGSTTIRREDIIRIEYLKPIERIKFNLGLKNIH